MFGSEILDVAIGLILVFLLLSLIVSSIKEALETFLNHRSSDLERGLREMFGDRRRQSFIPEFYQHPLVRSLFAGDYKAGVTRNLPSYIPSQVFALALIDLLAKRTAPVPAPGQLQHSEEDMLHHFQTALADLPGGTQLRGALTPLLLASGNNFQNLQKELEGWFDNSMERVAGWYKKRTQIIIASIGLTLAAFLNIDAVAVVRYLNTSQTARAVLMSRVEQFRAAHPANDPSARDKNTQQLQGPATTELLDPLGWLERQGGLPIGWVLAPAPGQTHADFDRDWRRPPMTASSWILKVIGILFTAFAVSLGAPFWFDLLNRFMIVRATVKPDEKSQIEKSKS